MKQYFTNCSACGKRVLMTQTDDGQWVPCRPNLYQFYPGGGPDTYINAYGKKKRGSRKGAGTTEFGYRLHRKDCTP